MGIPSSLIDGDMNRRSVIYVLFLLCGLISCTGYEFDYLYEGLQFEIPRV